jgi:mono/diheme cytochrome c family protein
LGGKIGGDLLRAGTILKLFFALVIAMLFGLGMLSRADENNSLWLAPENQKKLQNPVKPSSEGLAAGAHLYKLNCAGCHGVKGDGHGPAAGGLPQRPANFTDQKMMSEMTDGELFWKMSTGRGNMPAWEALTEMQRWQLVNYLRTFAAKPAPADKSR